MDTPTRPRGGLRRAALLVTTLVTALVAAAITASPAVAARRAPDLGTGASARGFGVTFPGAPTDLSQLSHLTDVLGRAPSSVMWYSAWGTGADFPAEAAGRIAATGAVPEVTWEPWAPGAGVDQQAFSLDRIAAGAHDTYLRRWARQIRGYKKPVVIRLAHEMNGSWYPWAEQVNGNTPGDYVTAWRHVVDLFRSSSVRNVTWVWSPNVPYPGSTPLASLYPGDAYVDRVALDGYNWAGLQPGTTWTSFADLFLPGVAEVRSITSRPIWVGEVGCPESGGDKAAWVADMFDTLAAHPEIAGFTWFDFAKEADWRIESSPQSAAAFRTGLAAYS